jgi:hypothetical protein
MFERGGAHDLDICAATLRCRLHPEPRSQSTRNFLDFREDQMATVVVFPADLRDVGDVRRLAGHTIEVSAAARLYDSRTEIVLKRISPVAG